MSTIVLKPPLPDNPCEMEMFALAELESLESDIENDEESDWESFPQETYQERVMKKQLLKRKAEVWRVEAEMNGQLK